MVSVMLANNEVGTLQPIAEIATQLSGSGVLLHTDAAHEAGYFDQAHFIHDFKAVTGITPDDYLRHVGRRYG
ncbi:helix-turn-helix domain-containing protein [Halomonas sp. LBP4]|uniref:helix-turn-helix domain-containing protein n=1 Tax=Halomonas sp. LBP4 TaxID=2044917 RepID=UPI000D9472E8|nr:helix-turn-helix domain-containing protein [Halomonas sp. LBP4]PXX98382.1 hypothetical protein CR157_08745 [Halomonas sp. LBP4]